MDDNDFGNIGALALVERINSLTPGERSALDRMLGSLDQQSKPVASPVSIGIVTALEIETLAVERALLIPADGVQVERIRHATAPHAPVAIRIFRFTTNQLTFQVALTQAIKMGNNSASVATTSLLYEFPEITDILMVGIAGGIPSPIQDKQVDQKLIDEHVRLGDIFIAELPIYQYDYVKVSFDKTINRDIPNSISPRLKKTFQRLRLGSLESKRPWESYLSSLISGLGRDWRRPAATTDRPRCYQAGPDDTLLDIGGIVHPTKQAGRQTGKPLVHYGKIGSANTLLKNPLLRDELRSLFGVRAVEMEGSGVADASWNFGVGYGVVRGICDYCDPQKGDYWQKYAAAAAAAYCRAIIDDVLEEKVLLITQRSRQAKEA